MTIGLQSAVRFGVRRSGALPAATEPATLRLGARRVPRFRSIGIAGYHAALLVALVAGFRADVHPIAVLGLSGAAAASFFLWALLRRAVTGRESLVLLEHVWAAFAAVGGFCIAAGVDVLAGSDVLACGLCVFLAAGRVGCHAVGCCYGVPAGVGVVYPAGAGVPARLAGVPLLPVQLIEAAALLLIGGVTLALAGGPSGEATVWFLLAYATVRFGTESLRADDRPALGGVGVPRWMCLLQVAGASLLAWQAMPGADRRVVVATAAMLAPAAVAGLVLTVKRRPTALTRPEALDETWSVIETLAGSMPPADRPAVATTRSGVRVAASLLPAAGDGRGDAVDVHVSLSGPRWTEAELFAVADALAALDVRPAERAVHGRIDGVRLRLRGMPELFARLVPVEEPIMEHVEVRPTLEVDWYFGRDEERMVR